MMLYTANMKGGSSAVAVHRLAPAPQRILRTPLRPAALASGQHPFPAALESLEDATMPAPPPLASKAPLQQPPAVAHLNVGFVGHLVQDFLGLVQMLWQLVSRVRTAAAAIKLAVDARAAAPKQSAVPATAAASYRPVSASITAATASAVGHLYRTLTDASGTLDAKWRALDTTTTHSQAQLFHATRASAHALGGIYQGNEEERSALLWARHSTAAVVEEEEALKQQVFAQVFAQLNAAAAQEEARRPRGMPFGFGAA